MGIVAALGVIAGARLAIAGVAVAAVALAAGLLVIIILATGYTRLLGATLLAGCLAGGVAGYVLSDPPVPSYLGDDRVRTRVIVTSDPEQTPGGLRVNVDWQDQNGVRRRSAMFADAWPAFHRGDALSIVARVDGPEAEMLFASSLTIERHAGPLEERRARLRRWLDRTVRSRVGGSEGALALGLLIGDDSALTRDEEDVVRRAGLSHITAVSGWNVTLVVAVVGTLLLALGLRGPGWVGVEVAALVGYVWLVGADAPVVRAAIMGAWVIVARQLGRPAHGPTLIAFAAALMIAVDPSAPSSLSFQLSILATAALIVAVRYAARWHGWRAIVLGPLVATVAISVATAPALAAWTGTVSVVSVPANIVAAPLVPLAAAGSIVVVATGWLPALQTAAAAATWLLTHLILSIAAEFASVPGGVVTFAPVDDVVLRGAVVMLLVVAAFVLPEGRFVAWQIDRWMRRDERAAAIVTGGLAVGVIALVAIAVP